MINIQSGKEAPSNVPQPGVYRHYKGSLYQVLGVARHSETEEWLVVYQALYGEQGYWLRPLNLWLEPVEEHLTTDAPQDSQNSSLESASASTTSRTRFTLITPNSVSLQQITEPS